MASPESHHAGKLYSNRRRNVDSKPKEVEPRGFIDGSRWLSEATPPATVTPRDRTPAGVLDVARGLFDQGPKARRYTSLGQRPRKNRPITI